MTKQVVYQATCKACSKSSNGMEEGENVGYSYIGETSRQVGTRVNEHINNMRNWKKESLSSITG